MVFSQLAIEGYLAISQRNSIELLLFCGAIRRKRRDWKASPVKHHLAITKNIRNGAGIGIADSDESLVYNPDILRYRVLGGCFKLDRICFFLIKNFC